MINKLLVIGAFILLTISSIAQNSAEPNKIAGKDVYIFFPPTEYSITSYAKLTDQQINQTNSLEKRIQLAIQSSSDNYDVISTRDGINIQFLKYKGDKQTSSRVLITADKEIYFLSTPKKEYKTIDTKTITKTELSQSFYTIAETYVSKKAVNKQFDAIIFSDNKAEYIRFK